MIQLQYQSTGSSEKVIWSDLNPPFSGSVMTMALTSSFEGNYDAIDVDVVSNTSNALNGGWILFNVSSSLIPTSSGFYTADVFIAGLVEPQVWQTAADVWETISQVWEDYQNNGVIGEKITTERVFVLGSDYDEQYKYENQELSYYSVYNG